MTPPDDTHILHGAFGDEPQTVPLVVYENEGVRRVVGEATITPHPDKLVIEGHISDAEMAEKFTNAIKWMDGFSLLATPSPKPRPKQKDPLTPEERQAKLLIELQKRPSMTVNEAWTFGHQQGFYLGGDAADTKADLDALCASNKADRTDGFWRHINEADRIRLKHAQWADYWTARKRV